MTRPAPPLKADRGYLEAFTELMRRLGAATRPGKPLMICVGGGAALHLYTGTRVSKDVDAKVMARFIPPENLEVSYADRDGHARLLYFDTARSTGESRRRSIRSGSIPGRRIARASA